MKYSDDDRLTAGWKLKIDPSLNAVLGKQINESEKDAMLDESLEEMLAESRPT